MCASDIDIHEETTGVTTILKFNFCNLFDCQVHINLQGNLIPLEDQKFVYIPGKNDMEVEISTPLTAQSLKDIMPV